MIVVECRHTKQNKNMSYSLGNDGLTQIDIVAEYEQCYKMYVNINEVGHHARMI